MILEKFEGFKDILQTGYWFKSPRDEYYIITLEDKNYFDDGRLFSFNAVTTEVIDEHIDDDIDISNLENGQEVKGFASFGHNWRVKISISSKYYFPKFDRQRNKCTHTSNELDVSYIDEYNALLSATYDIAMKESGLKTY